jgi:hypothetical protein
MFNAVLSSFQGNNLVRNVKNLLTTSVARPYSAPDTILKALKFQEQGRRLASTDSKQLDPKLKKILAKIKYGHILGLGLGILGFFIKPIFKLFNQDAPEQIKKFIPTSFLAGLASFCFASFVTNPIEESKQADLDRLVQRYEVDADGNSKDLKEGSSSLKFPSLEDVILSDANKEELDSGLAILKEKARGGVFCLRGITRCGKTMTSKALARHLAQETGKKAQYWYAAEETMTSNLADKEKFIGEILGIESTIKKIERIISRAIVESNKGETPIVIVLDEAHKMLGGNRSRFDANNPHHTDSVVESLKRLFSETINTGICKGIYLVMTANSSASEIAAPMRERMVADLFYDKPSEDERFRFMKHVLKREMTEKAQKLDFQFSDIDDKEILKIAKIGTCNLLQKFGSTNEDHAFDEAVRAGFGGNVEELRKRPMLTNEAIEKIIMGKIAFYANGKITGGKMGLLKAIEDALESKLKAILDQKSGWQGELLHYFGANTKASIL